MSRRRSTNALLPSPGRQLPNKAAECLMSNLLSAVRITSPAGPIGERVRVSLEKQTFKQTSVSATLHRASYSKLRFLITAEFLRRQPCRDPARQGSMIGGVRGSRGRSSLICAMHDTRVATAERTRGTSGHRGASNLGPQPLQQGTLAI
ncbi:hypothetical protein V8C44DRAFT_319850, partial [Trichoderma aethiopicum]